MWPTGGARSAKLSVVMKTNTVKTTENGAATKVESAIKPGLDVHAAQITVCRQIDGSLPQPPHKMSWEKCVAWNKQQAQSGAKLYSCHEACPGARSSGTEAGIDDRRGTRDGAQIEE